MATAYKYRCGCVSHPVAGFIARCPGNPAEKAITGIGKRKHKGPRKYRTAPKEAAKNHKAAMKRDKVTHTIRGLIRFEVALILP